ncbi:GNAT family N-acetyltransferase [Streptomyces lydicamycinicus]|uniref:Putative acetyltransferase n=1 Tax=Streptomyces lydicamycinicus TaxID=1546107 RepID=A0A0P4R9P9_9ACTN|nr:GNAT family N-acetyltransferase [Streptomyces lydicamycinicus]USA02792.1 GNAT family N-acetyltransferase [Streptomyces lydicamycinicus]GAO09645.1 putative acetyltransferase [Streptomyces lydicamycinicus]
MEIRPVRYDHPDAVALDALVQQEYARRYGDDGDITPLTPEMFTPPHGMYLIAYDGTRPLATGGWRRQEDAAEGYAVGDAEIKRMFVLPEARGRGLARRILAALEADARAAGRSRMVLETGTKQPEALELYASSGYVMVEKFGLYRTYEESRCMAKALVAEG